MELRIRRQLIANVALMYEGRHYSPRMGWRKFFDFDPETRCRQLLALPENATPEQVKAIVGTGYVENVCNECGQDVEITVRLGEEESYEESYTAWICADCLRKALALVEAGGILSEADSEALTMQKDILLEWYRL